MSDITPPRTYSDEKKVVNSHGPDVEGAAPTGRARWFGGANVGVGPRIAPVLASTLSAAYGSDSDDSSSAILHKQKEAEANATIKYRTCSWQKVCVPLSECVLLPTSRRLFPCGWKTGWRGCGARFVGVDH